MMIQPCIINSSYKIVHFFQLSIYQRWRDCFVARVLPKIKEDAWPLVKAGMDMYIARMSAIMVGYL